MAGSAPIDFDIDFAVQFFAFGDLLNFRVADRRAGGSLAGGRTWAACARKELPGFEFSYEHFDQPQRRRVIALVFALIKRFGKGAFQPTRRSRADIYQLSKLVSDARQVVAAHSALEGGTAGYLVAHVRFLRGNQPGSTAFSAEPIGFPDAPGVGALRFHFALRGGALLVAARRDGLPPESIKVRENMSASNFFPSTADMSLDMTSVDPQVIMHYRGLSMTVDGPFEEAFPGMMSFAGGAAAASDALVQGVLCVFVARSGEPKATRPMGNYLNLEIINR